MPQKYKVLPGKKPIAGPPSKAGPGSIPASGSGIPDRDFEAIERTLNTTIHELVFCCQHAGDDNVEDAQNALMTAQGNLEEVAEILLRFANS
jgi:hypothetical protein